MLLDDAYANAAYIPQASEYPQRWVDAAAAFRQSHAARATLDVSYGDSARQCYDFFAPETPARGTLIFVHGGYWLKFDKSYWSHLGQGALERGWNVAFVQYDLCPAVSIAEITNQIAKAVTAIAARDSLPLSLSGHSAGGHLVARMLAPGVLAPDVLSRVAAVAPISPVADLRPLLQTSMNSDFKMDLAAAEAESPVMQPAPDTPVHIRVGQDERPVFVEQAQALADEWSVPVDIVAGLYHFDIIDALQDAQSDVTGFLTSQTA